MANKKLFSTPKPKNLVKNVAGGLAYSYDDEHALAQIACTNTFNDVFYASGDQLLEKAKELVVKLSGNPTYLAQVAIYARQNGYMKDMPAFIVAYLATLGNPDVFKVAFEKVIDSPKMLRTFCQIARSGQVGKRINLSAGSVRKAINKWFESKSAESIFRGSIGNDPSMKDILRMARPKPENKEKAALYAYLREADFDGKRFIVKNKEGGVLYSHKFSDLPKLVQEYENFKKTRTGNIPNVDFRMLDSFLNKDQFKELWTSQLNGSWQLVRMNLNNLQKYGVLNSAENVTKVAEKLKNPEEIAKAKAFPYQLMMAYHMTDNVPMEIKEALQDALDISTNNVPSFKGKGAICIDISGSMASAVTGNGPAASKVRCVDVAALMASVMLRQNKNTKLIPFHKHAVSVSLNPRDSVITNASKFNCPGGGTDCSSAIRELNNQNFVGDYVVMVSDNQSWIQLNNGHAYSYQTSMNAEWNKFKVRNPNAKLICIDLQPYGTSQVSPSKDVLMVGGFSDSVFQVISDFLEENSKDFWVKEIKKIDIRV